MRRIALLIAILVLATWAGAQAVSARSIIVQSFDANIAVSEDGVVDVTENITVQFTGSWNGIYRFIPVEYRTPQGFNYRLFLDMVGITDSMGQPLRHESRRRRHYREFKIWIPGAEDATRTAVLHYRVQNGLKFFEGYDELYWNITGDEWEMPIQAASATIALPQKAAGLRAVAFTGGYGSREQAARIAIEGNIVNVEALRSLSFREGLTVAVAWNPGVVQRPTALKKVAFFLRSNSVFAIPLLAFLVMFWLWRVRGRDPRARPAAVQYEPPQGMSPAELGTLVDNAPHMRDITATLVDLAVRGYLFIEEEEKEQFLGLFTKKEYTLTLRKGQAEWKDLAPHERELLDAIFTGGVPQSVPLSALENSFYRNLPGIRDRIFDGLVKSRYYRRRPDKVRKTYVVGAVLAGGACAVLAGAIGRMQQGQMSPVIASLLTMGAVGGFGWFMPARTIKGARTLENILGFEEFLGRVEADRFERVVKTPEMFEQFLPYAMALGVERNWARAFADIYRQAPEWYRGAGLAGFSSHSLASDLSQMSARAGTAMASSPRSSGGSGFGGGGGSSGGGFGGGGGGGF